MPLVQHTTRSPRAIVLLASNPYPPISGNKRRAASIIESLGRRYTVSVLAADAPDSGTAIWADASERFNRRRHSSFNLASDLLEGLLRGWPVLLTRSNRAGLPAAFRGILEVERPEVVVLGRPLLVPYLEVAQGLGATVLVEADESMPNAARRLAGSRRSPMLQRIRAFVEAALVLGRLERSAYPRADQVWVASERERHPFLPFVAADRLHVIPNVIDLPAVLPPVAAVVSVAFLGWYPYPPNEAAALELIREVMPAVRAAGGPHQLVLIGPAPSPAMVAAAAATGQVEILGEVADVRQHLRSAGVLVVPIRSGGGTRVKILEAITAGVPVVSTRIGMEGLDLRPEEDILVAETADEFAVQVRRLMADDDLRLRLATNAFDRLRGRYSTDVLDAAVDTALRSIDQG